MGRCSPPHGHAAWRGHAVRARRFPRETQAGASIGKADRASSGGRGSNVSQSGAFVRRSRTNAQASRPRTHDAFAHVETGCLCGNEYCRLCRSKTVRSAQRRQHGMTEPSPFQGKQHFSYLKFRANFSENRLSRATRFPRAGSRAYAVCPQLRRSRLPPSDR